MNWAERLSQERRARLAAERRLEQKTRDLLAAQQELEERARGLSNQISDQRNLMANALSEVASVRDQYSELLDELEDAHASAVRAERRLWDSIEAIRDGFAMFDADRALIGANRAWLRPFRRFPEVRPGIGYARLLEICAENGLVDLDGETPAAWVERMLARWTAPRPRPMMLRLQTGAWVKLIDRRARDGDMVCLALDVTDTVEYERDLERARERAEAANRAKSAFLANMSHEIRTPMNGVVGMAELLCETELTEDQRLYAETIRSSGEALLRIINDVLDYSKIEAGKLALFPEPFDLERCIHEVVLLLHPGARDRGLDIFVDFDIFLPTRYVADPGRVRQVLMNLIGNAVKFTETGHVMVRVTGHAPDSPADAGDRQNLHVTVEDTGIGIPPDQRDLVFAEFSQVEADANRKFEGTGLGLAITRQLLAMMGGEMWLDSEPGRGSCFGFRLSLPVAEERAAAAPAQVRLGHALVVDDQLFNRTILERQLGAQGMTVTLHHAATEALKAIDAGLQPDVVLTDQEMPGMDGVAFAAALRARGWQGPILLLSSNPARLRVSEAAALCITVLQKPVLRSELIRRLAEIGAPPDEPEPESPPAPAQPAADEPRQMRVLSAEDNRTNQLVLAKMLKDLDIELSFANDGHEAVAMFESGQPDLILMDISMPGMDGRAATRAIRRREKASGRRVPIIALTAHAMEGDRDAIVADGLDDYLTKPLKRAAIVERILAHVPEGVRPPRGAQAAE